MPRATLAGVQHPGRQDDDHAGARPRHGPSFRRYASHGYCCRRRPPEERVPAIVDLDFLPDMGRMTARLRSGDLTGCFAGSLRRPASGAAAGDEA